MRKSNTTPEDGFRYWFPYVWNRTALGVGVLLGLWSLYQGDLLRVGYIFVFVLVYFWLHSRLDAP